MTAKPFARTSAFAIASIACLAAALVVAGPAAAHHEGKHHHHHHRHHHHHFDHHFGDGSGAAGTVASFDPTTGKLVIDPTEGDPVSGYVTQLTWIECGCDHSGPMPPTPQDSRHQLHDWSDGDDWHHGDWNGDHSSCTTANLVPGAVVKEADLDLKDGKALFERIELEG